MLIFAAILCSIQLGMIQQPNNTNVNWSSLLSSWVMLSIANSCFNWSDSRRINHKTEGEHIVQSWVSKYLVADRIRQVPKSCDTITWGWHCTHEEGIELTRLLSYPITKTALITEKYELKFFIRMMILYVSKLTVCTSSTLWCRWLVYG